MHILLFQWRQKMKKVTLVFASVLLLSISNLSFAEPSADKKAANKAIVKACKAEAKAQGLTEKADIKAFVKTCKKSKKK